MVLAVVRHNVGLVYVCVDVFVYAVQTQHRSKGTREDVLIERRVFEAAGFKWAFKSCIWLRGLVELHEVQ